MKKMIITITVLCVLSGIIGVSLNNTQPARQSVLNAVMDNGMLYADGLPGDTDTIRYPHPPPDPPIK